MMAGDEDDPFANAVPLSVRLRERAGQERGPSWMDGEPAETRALFVPPPAEPPEDFDLYAHPEFVRQMQAAQSQAAAETQQRLEAELSKVLDSYAQGARRLIEAAHRAGMPRANEVAELALMIASSIIGREASLDVDIVTNAIREAMKASTDTAAMTFRVSPGDLEHLRARGSDMLDRLRIVEDESVSPGGCVMEGLETVVDASVEARLAAVRESLQGLLKEHYERPDSALAAQAPANQNGEPAK